MSKGMFLATTSSTHTTLDVAKSVRAGANASNVTRRRVVPFVIQRDQVYYWTRTWQQGEEVE